MAGRNDQLRFRRGKMRALIGDNSIGASWRIPSPPIPENGVMGHLDRTLIEGLEKRRMGREAADTRRK